MRAGCSKPIVFWGRNLHFTCLSVLRVGLRSTTRVNMLPQASCLRAALLFFLLSSLQNLMRKCTYLTPSEKARQLQYVLSIQWERMRTSNSQDRHESLRAEPAVWHAETLLIYARSSVLDILYYTIYIMAMKLQCILYASYNLHCKKQCK